VIFLCGKNPSKNKKSLITAKFLHAPSLGADKPCMDSSPVFVVIHLFK
jgi:hypothetical protein